MCLCEPRGDVVSVESLLCLWRDQNIKPTSIDDFSFIDRKWTLALQTVAQEMASLGRLTGRMLKSCGWKCPVEIPGILCSDSESSLKLLRNLDGFAEAIQASRNSCEWMKARTESGALILEFRKSTSNPCDPLTKCLGSATFGIHPLSFGLRNWLHPFWADDSGARFCFCWSLLSWSVFDCSGMWEEGLLMWVTMGMEKSEALRSSSRSCKSSVYLRFGFTSPLRAPRVPHWETLMQTSLRQIMNGLRFFHMSNHISNWVSGQDCL